MVIVEGGRQDPRWLSFVEDDPVIQALGSGWPTRCHGVLGLDERPRLVLPGVDGRDKAISK